MLRHRELLGDELHNARISIEPPTRSPAFIGETVFDGTVLWIATGHTAESWTASHSDPAPPQIPPFFSWSLDLSGILTGFDTVISLYFSSFSAEIRAWADWTLLNRYTLGTNLPAFEGCINLNGWVEQRGKGRYLPLVSRSNLPRPATLAIAAINPASAAAIVNVGRVTEPGTARIYNDARAIEVSKCQAGFAGSLLTL
ncbi:hypothetical protein H6F67_10945 [Microcoleus sp. FACHB-1515]|uniref:hypothetical protein n=1 Tax=Cyanophyceae TaxID=3028117 RepID=UPI0016831E92|nr:hypothetical protein [Microcoleus sp. FACHB-1515]MBD2090371.1 hypothetical protein [Microcoleus sp. FACHB-1515]